MCVLANHACMNRGSTIGKNMNYTRALLMLEMTMNLLENYVREGGREGRMEGEGREGREGGREGGRREGGRGGR